VGPVIIETQKTCNYAVDGLNLSRFACSTLNYPFTFAYFMMAGLLLLLSSKEALRVPLSGWFLGLLTIGSTGCLGRLVCGIAYLCHFSKGTLPAALSSYLHDGVCIY